jgi:hypothetical protein
MSLYIQYKANYSMVHLHPVPRGFIDVHLTISSDTATREQSYDEEGRLVVTTGDVWKLPHVTFQWQFGPRNEQRNFHVFINVVKGKYTMVNSGKQEFRRPSANQKIMLDIASAMLKLPKIKDDILFQPENYVKDTAEADWVELR